MAPFLELSHISKRFGGVIALRDVDLALNSGEVHCLCGENGSGKSTLVKIIAGVFPPSPGGRIVIGGQAFEHLSVLQSMAFGVHVIYQDLSLFPNLTVAENVAVGQHRGGLHRVRWQAMQRDARAALEKLGVSIDLDAKVGGLSIAQRQLVAICRALAADARLLIMDEPTASLTRHEVDSLLRYVGELKKRGLGIVFVSHRLDEILQVADRVTVMRDGARVGTFDPDGMDYHRLSFLMTGKEFRYGLQPEDTAARPAVLEVTQLTRRGEYEDVSLTVHAGEVVGLIGLLGSGRTELALSLFGMTRPDRGTIRLRGGAIALRSNRDAIRHGIAYVPEDRLNFGLALDQSITTNILASTLGKLAGPLGLIEHRRRRDAAAASIHELAIKVANPAQPARVLSGGNQQRVVLAKWLAARPELLILDSPTAGVDIGAKDGIYELIRRLAAQGLAVILISDEVPEVFYHAHRVLIMRNGRIAQQIRPAESSEARLKEAVYA
jgi:simple sugar transport system ATP-binding protein